jgi:hypothetical protein
MIISYRTTNNLFVFYHTTNELVIFLGVLFC